MGDRLQIGSTPADDQSVSSNSTKNSQRSRGRALSKIRERVLKVRARTASPSKNKVDRTPSPTRNTPSPTRNTPSPTRNSSNFVSMSRERRQLNDGISRIKNSLSTSPPKTTETKRHNTKNLSRR